MAIKKEPIVSLRVINWKKEFARIEREVEKRANFDIRQRIDFATSTLRRVTPVDTGRARRGWNSFKYYDRNGFLGATISNRVPYIVRLNKGHSRQAPKFFIEQVLMTIGILTP
jgi:hypothetical protein